MMVKRRLETMETSLSNRDIMICFLGTLPKAYKTTVNLAEKDLVSESLTIDELKELLWTKFDKLKVLNNQHCLIYKKFKGPCKVCGKLGTKPRPDFLWRKTNTKRKRF